LKPIIILSLVLMIFVSCKKQGDVVMNMDNLYAWCIVPFDAKQRTPAERIEMLKRLGFNKYAYDWRVEHLNEMAEEIQIARENGIEIVAVWMWIDNEYDKVDALSSSNERVFDVLGETGLKTQIWVSFHPNFFERLSGDESVKKGAQMIGYLCGRAKPIGCKIALYNHGDWFGEPANEIKIIQSLPECEIGLVYNFHHAHDQLDHYAENVAQMMPYLLYVNINGMRKEVPKILPIGQGNLEKGMIQLLLDKGYKGLFGILGHVEDADVELVLKENIKGFRSLNFKLDR
jgi:sugar phosphate isomerase/epimerase